MSPWKKLIQISQGRRLHRSSSYFSVTARIDALRTKETTNDNGFIGEAFPLKSFKNIFKVALCCVGKEQMTSYSMKLTEIAEEIQKDYKNPQIPNK